MQRLQMRWYAGAILCVLSAMVCMFVYQTRAFAASVTTTISVTPELGGSKLSEKLQSLEDTEQILVLDVVESTAGASGSSRLDLRIPTDKHITKVILQTQNGASLSNYTIFFCGTLPLRHGYKGLGVCGLTHRDALGITKRPDRENTWSGLLHWYLPHVSGWL